MSKEAQLPLPKRVRTIQTKLDVVTRNDALDLEYARMCVMSMCRTGFLESPWVKNFFSTNFNYQVPSRRKVMRGLIPLLYKDVVRRVKVISGLTKEKRNYCTLTTDG